MPQHTIDYQKLVEQALRHVIHDTLSLIATEGLPGRHNIYITFMTSHPGVVMAKDLLDRYPTEMTIVLQHEYWDLKVGKAGFSVTLSFSDIPYKLEIPFTAITVFADPSVEFGLQFNVSTEEDVDSAKGDGESEAEITEIHASKTKGEKRSSAGGDSAEVVTLDQFRKKP